MHHLKHLIKRQQFPSDSYHIRYRQNIEKMNLMKTSTTNHHHHPTTLLLRTSFHVVLSFFPFLFIFYLFFFLLSFIQHRRDNQRGRLWYLYSFSHHPWEMDKLQGGRREGGQEWLSWSLVIPGWIVYNDEVKNRDSSCTPGDYLTWLVLFVTAAAAGALAMAPWFSSPFSSAKTKRNDMNI